MKTLTSLFITVIVSMIISCLIIFCIRTSNREEKVTKEEKTLAQKIQDHTSLCQAKTEICAAWAKSALKTGPKTQEWIKTEKCLVELDLLGCEEYSDAVVGMMNYYLTLGDGNIDCKNYLQKTN